MYFSSVQMLRKEFLNIELSAIVVNLLLRLPDQKESLKSLETFEKYLNACRFKLNHSYTP